MINSYRDLDVFKLAKELDLEIYRLSVKFPNYEQFGLADQLRRSTHSIVANIAEGYGRKTYIQEFKRFLAFAQASCDETRVHLEAAKERGYITAEVFGSLDEKLDHVGRMLFQLAKNWKV